MRPRTPRVCNSCGSEFLREQGAKNNCCSALCARVEVWRSGKTNGTAREVARAPRPMCAVCGRECRKLDRLYCSVGCRRSVSVAPLARTPKLHTCGECGASFESLQYRVTCSPACQHARQRKNWASLKTPARREQRRAAKRTELRMPPAEKAAHIDRLMCAQGGACLNCGDTSTTLFLDHCHATNKPRALLCRRCNAALGLLLEDPARCRALAVYAEVCQEFRG